MAMPPVPVSTAHVVRKAVPIEVRTFGTVEASATVAVKSQIGGMLTNIHFAEGADVRQDDLLFAIDSRQVQAALKQAEANLARDTAQHTTAAKELRRQEELLQKGFAAEGSCDEARGAAEALAAAMRAAEAAIENLKLQLGYCAVKAPVAGRAGAILIHQGNIVKPNDTPLVVIHALRPVKVGFDVPQQHLPAIRRELAGGRLAVRVAPSADDPISETGGLDFIDNAVNPATGTIQLKGLFPNTDLRLWPGQFVSVVLTLAVETNALAIPSQAVQTGQKGAFVYVVKADGTVEDRPVVVNRTLDDEAVIDQGLNAGEQVVTDGQLRLRPGAKVQLKNSARDAASRS
jgi:multidrug efflux system membrane fusion protein